MTATSSMIGERLGTHVEALKQASQDSVEWAHRRATAKRAYKKAYGKAFAKTEGTVAERKAQADLMTLDELYEFELSEAMHYVSRGNEDSERTVVTAFQSWSRNVTEELRLTGLRNTERRL